MKIIGIIPARYGSTRLPGKPLKDICGKPMIWWVYNQAKQVKELEEIIVATDNEEIMEVCNKYEINVCMTRKDHLTAINRLQEVSQKVKADFFVQINGDEPLIEPRIISAVIPKKVITDIEFGTNVITKISDPVEVMDPANIKVVYNDSFSCLYMSRTPIPYPFKTLNFKYYKHVGVIGYNQKMLDFYCNSVAGTFEQIEGIDLLRFTDYGKRLQLIEVENCKTLSVDTEKDLERVRYLMSKKLKLKK
jgi:3-deoxy-manno-octulosonate cytidylyltransferase (CMP-KDO synthetase)